MNILVLANPSSPATDYYRTTGAFMRLAKITPDINIRVEFPTNVKWHHIYEADVMVVSRPNGDEILNFLAEAKRMGKKIVVDIDDLLHGLTEANPAAKHFNKPEIQRSIETALELADTLIVSTPYLQDYYRNHYTGRIHVIPNCSIQEVTPYGDNWPVHEPLRVFWRGSTTHLADLHTIANVWNIMGESKEYNLMFIGVERFIMPWFKGKATFVPWQTLFALWEGMRNSAMDVGIFPLTNDPFNLSKSNIFALEVLTAGGVVLAPEGFPEFEHPGVLTYKNPMHLQIVLKDLQSGKIDKVQAVNEGRAWMEEHRNIDQWNQVRKSIVNSL